MTRNARNHVMVLPGDGIGPEVIRQAERMLEWFATHRGLDFTLQHGDFGVGAYYRKGRILQDELLADILAADLVLFGAMGGGADHRAIPQEIRLREGLPGVRKAMQVYANIRPVKPFPVLAAASPIRADVTEGVDMLVIRELIGGIYFGEPRGIETLPDGTRRGINTHVYTTLEIQRIGRIAFDLARARRKHVTSVDKANVMVAGALWRSEIEALQAQHYPDIALDHMYVDNCAMQIVRAPRQFDVLVTDNLFGDILSDCASTISGSLGMLPSASLSDPGPNGLRRGLYEPAHGSAPDIAGQDKANPLAAILSVAMALEMGFERPDDAQLLERAVEGALRQKRTVDIAEPGVEVVSTTEMGNAVLGELDRLREAGA